MMSKIIRSPRAKADVLTAVQHIAEQSGSVITAERWLESVDERLKLLARHPLAGEARPDLASDVRAFPVGSYIIFYRPRDDGIELLRLLNAARDVPTIFRATEG